MEKVWLMFSYGENSAFYGVFSTKEKAINALNLDDDPDYDLKQEENKDGTVINFIHYRNKKDKFGEIVFQCFLQDIDKECYIGL